MNKNIILITMLPIWSMNNGSGGKALFSTVEAYSRQNYNIFIITNQENDYSAIKNIKKENIFYIDTKKYTQSYGTNKLCTYRYFKYFEKKSYRYICDIISRIGNRDVILYAYEVNAVKAAKKASNKYKIPLVTRFQGTVMSQYKNNLYYRIRKYPHIQALSTKSDLVIMTDDGTQGDKILSQYNNDSKRLFIKNGVNILEEKMVPIDKKKLREELKIPIDNTILITVSRLVDWKRVERSILAVNELENKEKYTLMIIGEGTERKNLENLVKKLEIQNNVKFMGSVKNEEVKRYMQLADIFLSFYDLSNVGNPLLEALCLGKPIITYDVGDTNKVINGRNGILLKDVSPKNIAKSIEKINNMQTLEEISENAKTYADKNLYSWKKRMEIEIEEVNKLYKEEV